MAELQQRRRRASLPPVTSQMKHRSLPSCRRMRFVTQRCDLRLEKEATHSQRWTLTLSSSSSGWSTAMPTSNFKKHSSCPHRLNSCSPDFTRVQDSYMYTHAPPNLTKYKNHTHAPLTRQSTRIIHVTRYKNASLIRPGTRHIHVPECKNHIHVISPCSPPRWAAALPCQSSPSTGPAWLRRWRGRV